MNQTLQLPGEVYRKLAQGASERGMTIEALLAAVSELVVLPAQLTEQDRQRSERVEKLLDRFRTGQLNADGRAELDQLIETDYQSANARADRLIGAKQGRTICRWRRDNRDSGPIPANVSYGQKISRWLGRAHSKPCLDTTRAVRGGAPWDS
jgi:hypothetical protein